MRTVLCAAVTAAFALAPQTQDIPRFRSTSDAVRVDVLVRDRNRPVTGLEAADFELRDSGVLQTIEAVAIEDVPVSLLLALDTSSSVETRLGELKLAARAALGALGADDLAALLTFSDTVTQSTPLTPDRDAVRTAIEKMKASGPTSLRDAVFTATALRERAAGRVVLLVFTDGVDTMSWLPPNAVLDAAVRSDMVIYAVSTADALYHPDRKTAAKYAGTAAKLFRDEPELFPHGFIVELTERTGGSVLFVQEGIQLAPAFAGIVSEFKSRYLLTYSPRNVPAGGWHPIEVKLKNRRADVSARRGYWR